MNGYPTLSQVEQVAHLPLTLFQPHIQPQPAQHLPALHQLQHHEQQDYPIHSPQFPQIPQLPQLPQPGVVTVVRDVKEKPEFNELAVGTNLTKAPRNWLTDDKRVC